MSILVTVTQIIARGNHLRPRRGVTRVLRAASIYLPVWCCVASFKTLACWMRNGDVASPAVMSESYHLFILSFASNAVCNWHDVDADSQDARGLEGLQQDLVS